MTGCENVDAVTIVVKLKNARGNRNPSLPFNLHPVRTAYLFLSDLTVPAKAMAPAKQELFGNRHLTCAGVKIIAKVSSSINFIV